MAGSIAALNTASVKLLALLVCSVAHAQVTAHFSPQPAQIPGLTEYQVTVCAEKEAIFAGGRIYAVAQNHIVPISRANVQAEYLRLASRSPWRIIALGIEGALWIGTALTSTDTIKIKERYRAAMPLGAAGLRTLTTLVKREAPTGLIPENIVPPLIQLPARGCAEYVLFARSQPSEVPFREEIIP